jgi:uncharacterized protein (UPF0128 family)
MNSEPAIVDQGGKTDVDFMQLTSNQLQESLLEAYLMYQMREGTRLMQIIRDPSTSSLKRDMANKKLMKIQKQIFRTVR